MKTRKTVLALVPILALGLALSLPVLAEEAPATAKKAPDFELKDYTGKAHKLSDYTKDKKWVVLEWINPRCPFVVKQYHPSHQNMQKLQKKYGEKGVVWLCISSTNPDHRAYLSTEQWKAKVADWKMSPKAVLMDDDGKTGKAYGAKTTPHMFVINPKGEIVYEGAIDSIRDRKPDSVGQGKNYVAEVLDAVLAGKPCPHSNTRPYGCSVKYPKDHAGM